jgi:hypothetical protein
MIINLNFRNIFKFMLTLNIFLCINPINPIGIYIHVGLIGFRNKINKEALWLLTQT